MPYSKSQMKATNKYRSKSYDQINVTTKKGMKEIYKAHAEKQGLSLNAYIVSLIEKDMESDDLKV